MRQPLRQLAAVLARRYPAVRILEAYSDRTWGDKRTIQGVRYAATLDVLKANGLLTDEMIEYAKRFDGRRRRPRPPVGDDFFLCESLDCLSVLGAWDLTIWTDVEEDPAERVDTRELRRAWRAFLEELEFGRSS
jgi:hypothetical protein